MARLSHRLEYLAAVAGVTLANSLSARAADSLGAGLGSVAYLLWRSRRRVATDNLKHAFGAALTDTEIRDVVKRVFRNIGRTVVEFARFRTLGRDGAERIVIGECRDMLERIHAEGKGALFITAHFGNWELLGGWPAALGFPVDFLVGEQHNAQVDRLLNGFRRQMGVGIIPLRTGIRGIFRSLKSNRFACVVADQHAPSGYVIVDFFGRKAATPKGPAAFAVKAGCPLTPFLMRRERYDRHVIIPGDPIYPPDSGDQDEDIRRMTQAYTDFFEKGIRQYPDQWMWTHRRWKL